MAEPVPTPPAEEIEEGLRGTSYRIGKFYEYKSKATFYGLPVLHYVNIPIRPGTKGVYCANGIVAVGICAIGLVPIGHFAFGFLAIGIFTVGLIAAIGFLSIGTVAAFGTFAVSLGFAGGNFAVAIGVALGSFSKSVAGT